MASKKFTLLAFLVIGAVSVGYSQLGGVLDYLDSSKINSKKLPQYNEWKSNSKENVFPPVPKAMGQLSIYGGMAYVDGDCPGNPGWNIGASYRKALGYVVSLRGSIGYGVATGLDYRKNGALINNSALSVYEKPWAGNPTAVGPGWYVANFQTTMITPSIDMIFSFNNIMFHRKSSKFNFYGMIGYTPLIYRTKMDVRNGSSPYNFASLTSSNANFFNRPRKDIRSDLKNFFDGSYETYARVNDRSANFDNGSPTQYQVRHSFSTGLGTEFRIASRWSLGLEFKYLFTHDDYIDGWIYSNGALTPDKDNIIFTNFSLNYNL